MERGKIKLPCRQEEDLEAMAGRLRTLVAHPRVPAVGEGGIDHLTRIPLPGQIAVMRLQAQIAEEVRKPLIIHLVRASAEVIRLKREIKPKVPWIIHGFRGGEALARELVRHGFSLSFGEFYKPAGLLIVPKNRLFIETDESNVPVITLYERAARLLKIPTETLLDVVGENIGEAFLS